jgi:diacylglycerol kinase family enzyme
MSSGDDAFPLSSLICVLPADQPSDEYTLIYLSDENELKTNCISHPPAQLIDGFLLRELPPHLSPTSTCNITVIVSTASGGGLAAKYYEKIILPLSYALRISPEVVHTISASTIAETIISLSKRPNPQTVVLLSGDTGIHDTINACSNLSSISLCIFPLGSGNALAASYHTSRSISPLRALLFGTSHPLPTFTVTFSPGSKWLTNGTPVPPRGVTAAVVISWGFHASLVADAEALRSLQPGVGRFQTTAKNNLDPPHRYVGQVSYLPPDSASISWIPLQREEHFYVLATMCSNLEENFCISPASVPGNMELRLVHFEPMEPSEVVTIMGAAYRRGEHVKDERVGYELIRGIRIEVGESKEAWRRICVDGGIVVVPEQGWAEARVNENGMMEGIRLVWCQ